MTLRKSLPLLLSLLVSCAIPAPRKVRQIAIPLPGGGKQMMASVALPSEPVFKPSAARLTIIPWRYDLPQGTGPSTFWWDVWHSYDGRNWSLFLSNQSVIPIIETTNKQEFFWLKGRL